jgi:hypothetical protein
MKSKLARIGAAKAVVGASLALLLCASGARADAIPYPNAGTPNTATYNFAATATGEIIAYFAGSTAVFDSQLGLLVNGIDTGVVGLDNHSSLLGQSFDLGAAHAGDTITFVLHNLTLGMLAFSDPTLNGSYVRWSFGLGATAAKNRLSRANKTGGADCGPPQGCLARLPM